MKADIISTAQHARPKVMGHIDPCLAQLTILSRVVRTYSASHQRKLKFEDQKASSPAPLRGVSRLIWLDPF